MDRRDADAAGDEDADRRRFRQTEIVAGRADREDVADLQTVEDEAGTAAPFRFALDPDRVGREIFPGFDKRVLPDQVVGEVQVDVSAGLHGGQWNGVDPAEFEEIDVAGRIADRRQAHFDSLSVVHGPPVAELSYSDMRNIY